MILAADPKHWMYVLDLRPAFPSPLIERITMARRIFIEKQQLEWNPYGQYSKKKESGIGVFFEV